VRVIAGEARGRPLVGPPGPQTRPTSDLVKGALFSMLETLLAAAHRERGAEIEPGDPEIWAGLRVLDLYAGTGSLGIEALSRGAAWGDFVESNAGARRTIERNLKTTGLAGRGRVIGMDVAKLARGGLATLRPPYGLVLLDPPYAETGTGGVLAELAGGDLLADEALVAAEHSRRAPLAAAYAAAGGSAVLVQVRQRRHGDTVVSIYRRESAFGRSEEQDGDHGDLSG